MKLSIVIPVYNSESTLDFLVTETKKALSEINSFEIILVNDASLDNSWKELKKIQQQHSHNVKIINLGKNIGENGAVMAGYKYAQGEYIVHMDDDMQNPPSEILKLLEKIKEGHDVVYSTYEKKMHSTFRNLTSKIHNHLATYFIAKPSSLYLSTFRIINRNLKEKICEYSGPFPYIDALILRTTSSISTMEVKHHDRTNKKSNYTFAKLLNITLNMIFSTPRSLFSWHCIITILLAILYLCQIPILSFLIIYIGLTLAIACEILHRLYLTKISHPQYFIKDIIG